MTTSALQAQETAAPTKPGTASPAPRRGELEQVIVTARRRAENIQKVPVAVTALSGSTLQRLSIVTQYDLPRAVPSLNVNIGSAGSQNEPELTIRGQRQGAFEPSVDPSVGVYLGDIVLERPYGFSQSLYDLSNVQVLKGPQGTLFGRNTTGGAVLVLPNQPTDHYDGMIHTSFGDYNLHEVDGFVNLPVNEKVQLRVAGQHTDRQGYIHDLANGQDDENLEETGVRVSLRLKPTEDIDNLAVVNYTNSTNNGTGYKLANIYSYAAAGALYPNIYGAGGLASIVAAAQHLGFYETRTDGSPAPLPYASSHAVTVANTTTYRFDDLLNVKNIFGYDHYAAGQYDDNDGSPLPILSFGDRQGGDQFTEELQVYGKTEHMNYILGGYYFRENAFSDDVTQYELSPFTDGILAPQGIIESDNNTSRSVFGQLTYNLGQYVPGLSATFGGRETFDTRAARFGTIYAEGYKANELSAIGAPSAGVHCAFDGSGVGFQPYPSCLTSQQADFSKFTYNVSLDYSITPDKLVYFAHRLGYRTGGFGTLAISVSGLKPFAPETVNDYELGAKFDWHPGGMFLRTNVAIYEQDYNNIQRLVASVLPNGATATNIVNAASATINGAEAEIQFAPVEWLHLNGFFSQTQPKYNSFLVPGATPGSTINVASTAEFAGFARTTFGLTGRLTLPVPDRYGEAILQINYYHQSGYIALDSVVPEPGETTPGYGVINLRTEWNGVFGSKFNLAGFVNNLADARYLVSNYTLATQLGFSSAVAGPPRMLGVEASYRFGS